MSYIDDILKGVGHKINTISNKIVFDDFVFDEYGCNFILSLGSFDSKAQLINCDRDDKCLILKNFYIIFNESECDKYIFNEFVDVLLLLFNNRLLDKVKMDFSTFNKHLLYDGLFSFDFCVSKNDVDYLIVKLRMLYETKGLY